MSDQRTRLEVPSDDPRRYGGDLIGGPDIEDCLIDTRRAVLIDHATTTVMKGESDPAPMVGLLLEGRVNRSPDRARILYLLGGDAVAALITELLGVALRASQPELVSEVLDELAQRWRGLRS